jgi:uncharacterized protein YutE (UPF0331/DUF86 family)
VTDSALIAKKLAQIETAIADLRRLAVSDRLATDLVQRRFVEHTLQIAIQAGLDAASHIVSDERLGEPRTNRELFDLLQASDWIDPGLRDTMARMAGFRNILVHGYDDVDLAIVRDVVDHRLPDLEGYVAAIRARLTAPR